MPVLGGAAVDGFAGAASSILDGRGAGRASDRGRGSVGGFAGAGSASGSGEVEVDWVELVDAVADVEDAEPSLADEDCVLADVGLDGGRGTFGASPGLAEPRAWEVEVAGVCAGSVAGWAGTAVALDERPPWRRFVPSGGVVVEDAARVTAGVEGRTVDEGAVEAGAGATAAAECSDPELSARAPAAGWSAAIAGVTW